MNMVIYFVMMLMLKWWLKKQKWGGGCSCVSDDGKQPKAKIRIERALWLSWSFYLLKAIISWLSPSLLTISFPQFLQGKGKYQGRWRWPDCCTVLFLERHCWFWCQWCSCWRWWQCWWCLRCWRQWYISCSSYKPGPPMTPPPPTSLPVPPSCHVHWSNFFVGFKSSIPPNTINKNWSRAELDHTKKTLMICILPPSPSSIFVLWQCTFCAIFNAHCMKLWCAPLLVRRSVGPRAVKVWIIQPTICAPLVLRPSLTWCGAVCVGKWKYADGCVSFVAPPPPPHTDFVP